MPRAKGGALLLRFVHLFFPVGVSRRSGVDNMSNSDTMRPALGGESSMNERHYTTKQMGDAGEMLVAEELTLHGIPALKVPQTIGLVTARMPDRPRKSG
jgi:hypothetical protein